MILKLINPYNDGTTHLQFTPEQFIRRVMALIPPPRSNIIRYYGVLGARHKNRKIITSKVTKKAVKECKTVIYRTPWAELMKRVFKVDVNLCGNCGTKLELIASITSPIICKKILDHLKYDSANVCETPARSPPELVEFEYY